MTIDYRETVVLGIGNVTEARLPSHHGYSKMLEKDLGVARTLDWSGPRAVLAILGQRTLAPSPWNGPGDHGQNLPNDHGLCLSNLEKSPAEAHSTVVARYLDGHGCAACYDAMGYPSHHLGEENCPDIVKDCFQQPPIQKRSLCQRKQTGLTTAGQQHGHSFAFQHHLSNMNEKRSRSLPKDRFPTCDDHSLCRKLARSPLVCFALGLLDPQAH
jgi:hypothetical protein